MERAKRERTIHRRLFTVTANHLEEAIEQQDRALVSAMLQKLRKHDEDLQGIQNKIISIWLDDSEHTTDDELVADNDTADEYTRRLFVLEQKANEFVCATKSGSSSGKTTIHPGSASKSRRIKLPLIQLPVFDGQVKNWIRWWAQFKKIHEDREELDDDLKMHYLLQAIEKGTCARELVESFPPCGTNYEKAITQLKQRFGNDEVIIDHYVREVLQLVISKGSAKLSLRALYDKLMTQILALESLGLAQDKYAAFLYPLVESALPDEVLRAWNRTHGNTRSLTKLLEFVRSEVESEERIRVAKMDSFDASRRSIEQPTATCLTTSVKNDVKKLDMCVFCEKSSHVSSECYSALRMSLEQRKSILREKKACFVCLKKGHSANQCRRGAKCIVCSRRHYTIMCDSLPKPTTDVPKSTNEPTNQQVTLNYSNIEPNKTVLLQTLKVNIEHDGEVITVRALLDSGAQRSFIKSNVARKLNLKPIGEQSIRHNLFGGRVTKKRLYNVFNFKVSKLDGSFDCDIVALEQQTLCGYLPKLRDGSILSELRDKGISLTDCIDDESDIGLLIGSDVLGALLTGRSERIDDGLLAMETTLGWTIQGPVVGVYCSVDCVNTLHLSCTCDASDFWKLETLGIKDEAEIKSQKMVESEVNEFFKGTVRVDEEVRYEVRLPWKDNAKILESNYDLAVKRLASTTSRLSKLGILEDYNKVFDEWLDSGIIEEVQSDVTSSGHYMPHHAVVKESSATTKIRPVFDASAMDKNGLSLNTCLEKGANLIDNIPRLLLRFRKGKIAVTADIKQAFLQISLHLNDRDYLKFLWWRDINKLPRELKTYRHRRVVFGVTTSPYLLSATVMHHLDKYNCDTAAILRKSFYVDNCVVSVDSVDEMHHFIQQAKKIMLEGKFELRCWVTGPENVDEKIDLASVLGLSWDPCRDELFCKTPSPQVVKLTKRFLLSIAQRTFDPLGFLCPATIVPKLIIQKCWIRNLDWDQPLPDDLAKLAWDWLREVNSLSLCRIPRRLSQSDLSISDNSLLVFCDASQSAYACCIFLRSEVKGLVSVQLVMAKARVAPSKNITIPRIELLAALMASRLANEVRDSLELSCKEFYFTDSSIVLAWIKKKAGLNVFIHNRVKEIASRTNVDLWHHIPGDLNPADLPSRGCSPESLFMSQWWDGPSWVKEPIVSWPLSQLSSISQEVQADPVCYLIQESTLSKDLLYFSSYHKIIRMMAWINRFHFNCRRIRVVGNLTTEELDMAEKRIFKCLQAENFNDEFLKRLRFNVFYDSDGLLRVKSRLTLGKECDSNFVTPILLPGGEIIERLVTFKHKEFLHAGSQTTMAKLRESYWIIGIRRITRRVVRNCIICKRFSSKACSAPVPPLPVNRIHCGAPFEVTGVDFAGPLYLRSGDKCWIALFTCATYRAIHLELCVSLSTEEFLLALRRFLARRGNVRIIYSDNGTNFCGAHNVLNSLDWETVASKFCKIVWHFSPPAAPWWGGFWERMVRTVKELLRRVLGKAALSFNELVTVLCEAESVVNSRPLTYITDSSELLQPLTPATFLNFAKPSSGRIIDIELIDAKILSSRWRYLIKLTADLKSRFHSEYLSMLVDKSTSRSRYNLVKPGDIVLIENKDKKRIEWPLGVVKEVFEGTDGHKRVARVRTIAGERIRHVQSLFPLELHSTDVLNNLNQSNQKGGARRSQHSGVTSPPPIVTTRSGRTVKKPNKLLF